MTAPVAVFAIGNRSRGDDAVGPLLLDRLGAWLEERGACAAFELFEAYQLQVENALDLEDRRLALFIDARRNAPSPVSFGPVEALAPPAAFVSHLLEPGAVLGVLERIGVGSRPAAYALGVSATDFELGAGISGRALAAAEEAWPLLRELAKRPDESAWSAIAEATPTRPDPIRA